MARSIHIDSMNINWITSHQAKLCSGYMISRVKKNIASPLIRFVGNSREQPRTSEGGFWHKGIYPCQMWLDGMYMAEPFYAFTPQ